MVEQAAEQSEDQGEESAEEAAEEVTEEADESAENARSERAERFFALCDALRSALSDRPTLQLPELLSLEEQSAVEMLYEAKTAVAVDIGDGHISAVKRGKLVNWALAALQPLLAVGRSADQPQARGAYAEIQEKITELRGEITTQGGIEAVGFSKPGATTKPEDDEDDDDSAEGKR